MAVPRSVPSPHHPLHGFRLKLNRAQTYADALYAEIDAWFKRNPYEVYSEYEAGPPEQVVYKVRFLEAVPVDLSLIVGDFAHNARSSLDHLAYQVVLRGTGGQHRERTQFPISVHPFAWEATAKSCLKGATARHIGIIESLQPYHRTDLYGWHTFWAAIEDPLAVLNRLSNVDKHIVLNAMPAMVERLGWDFDAIRDVASIGNSSAPMGILLDEGELVRVEFVSSGPEPEIKLNRTETVEIWVQHRVNMGSGSYTLSNRPLKQSVEAILVRLREIFQIFVNEFR